jgi:hypothetical protein
VCPVEEEEDDGNDVVPAAPADSSRPARDGNPLAAALARLLDPALGEDAWREAAEDLHAVDTAEALRRLDRSPGHARAWAYLRDSRWDVAGAGKVPLLAPPAGPAAWAALAGLRLRRALRLAGSRWFSASVGGAVAGALAGLVGGLAMSVLGGSSAPSLLAALAVVGSTVAGLGAAGVGFGLAAAEALVRSWRTVALTVLGAAGGGLAGAVSRRAVAVLLDGLFGLDGVATGGGFEGLVVGAGAGLGFGLTTARMADGLAAPRGRARARTITATALACAVCAAGLSLAGGRLGAASLDAIVGTFPETRVSLASLGRLFGEEGLGLRTLAALGFGEGLLFGAGLAAGLTRRPRRSEEA